MHDYEADSQIRNQTWIGVSGGLASCIATLSPLFLDVLVGSHERDDLRTISKTRDSQNSYNMIVSTPKVNELTIEFFYFELDRQIPNHLFFCHTCFHLIVKDRRPRQLPLPQF